MALSDMKCRNARPSSKLQKFSDGDGLQLWVQPTGARLWRLAYRFGGKQKLLAIGTDTKARWLGLTSGIPLLPRM